MQIMPWKTFLVDEGGHLCTLWHTGAKTGVPNLETCCVIAKALSLLTCVQGPCETGETVDLSKHGMCASL